MKYIVRVTTDDPSVVDGFIDVTFAKKEDAERFKADAIEDGTYWGWQETND